MRILAAMLLAATVIITGCSSSGHHRGGHSVSSKQYGDVWQRIRAGFDMPDLKDSRVDYWVEYYRKRPQSVQTMAQRSSKYIYYVTTELEKRGMPTELALLPFVESAYNTTALSRAKASGLWQFMPATGKDFNLTQDWWRDDRRDPVDSTQAALNYLAYLYNFQGNDWHLALASYNWGQGSVKRARERNAAQGRKTDYLSLQMPQETRDYVPKLMAFKRIIANPSRYGITLPNVPDRPYFVEVPKTVDIDIDVAARLAGMSTAEFKEMNPQFHRPVILAEHRQRIILPKANAEQYKRNLANYRGELSSWSGYTPRQGESLAAIASRYGVDLAELKRLNGYGARQNVAMSSRTLLLPRRPGVSAAPRSSGSEAPRPSPVTPSVTPIAPAAPVASPVHEPATPDLMLALIERTQQQSTTAHTPSMSAPARSAPMPTSSISAATLASTAPASSTTTSMATASSAPMPSMSAPAPVVASAPVPVQPTASLNAAATPDPLAALLQSPTVVASHTPDATAMLAANSASSGANTSVAPSLSASLATASQAASSTLSSAVQYSGPTVQRVSWGDVGATSSVTSATSSAGVHQAAYAPSATPSVQRPVSSPQRPATHRVAKGETLYSLARQYGTTVEDLVALNNLHATGLQAGMVLRLPGSGAEG